MNIHKFKLLLFCLIGSLYSKGQNVNPTVEKVYVVFKTHLDVGYTDLSSVITDRYVNEFIPKALDLSERLAKEGSEDKYIWTTGSWLIWKYFQIAKPEDAARLDAAIRRGDIVWNAVPYTFESEVASKDLFETTLLLSQRLDKKYGKHTIAAKMTDVPGHTRSIVSPMYKAGIRFLHIGVNPASPIPSVPEFCRWRATDGSELILVYQQDYGSENLLPDGKGAISINFTGDNHGPHSYEKVKSIYANLRKRYPNAQLIPSSFNEIAKELLTIKDKLPVVTSEIADTWIYGFGSAPIRVAKLRALQRLYSQWIAQGKINKQSDEALNFALELGLIPEHTQGLYWLPLRNHWNYSMDKFMAARKHKDLLRMEASWDELDQYIYTAIDYLPQSLREEAIEVVNKVDVPSIPHFTKKSKMIEPQTWEMRVLQGESVKLGGLSYEMLDQKDFDKYLENYVRNPQKNRWAFGEFGKQELRNSGAVSVTIKADVVRKEVRKVEKGVSTVCELEFPQYNGIDPRVYPQKMYVEVLNHKGGKKADVKLTILGKPAVLYPESYWFSFTTEGITSIIAEKMGEPVDLYDVVEKGNRYQHGIDRYVDMKTSHGTIRVWSDEALLVSVGQSKSINYSLSYPDMKGGIHFNLSNNLWNTNFNFWNEGSLTYRFTIEKID